MPLDQNDPQTGKPRGTRNERKREFNRLLMEDVNRQRKNPQTPHIILIGDFNISLTKLDCHPRLRTEYPHNIARQQFIEEIMPGMGVVDVWREVHGPEAKGYSWFAVGKPFRSDAARVDYALVSEEAVRRVTSVEYLERMQGGSDHCPLLLRYKIV
jgi:exonuclease III